MADVFISYSRKDKEFVQQFTRRLSDNGRDVWVDFEDIPFGSAWWDEICRGIEGAHTMLFVISPDSLASKVCGLEVSYAVQNHKRLLPILYHPAGDTPVPPEIASLNWLSFSDPAAFEQSFQQLLQTLDTDADSLRRQTRLLTRAKEWELKQHSASLLLRGDDLDDLLPLKEQEQTTDLCRAYLERSQQQERRAAMVSRSVSGFAGGFIGVGFWTFSVFRSTLLITPERMRWTISMGGFFGLFVGLLALLADDVPSPMDRLLSERGQMALRAVISLLLAIAAWMSFAWFLGSLAFTPSDMNSLVLGGVGLAAGFIIRDGFKPSAWMAFVLTAVLTWLPVYITFTQAAAGSAYFVPLISFYDDSNQVFALAIPMVLLIALGANAPELSGDARSLLSRMMARRTPPLTEKNSAGS
jgi:hypothetical protein